MTATSRELVRYSETERGCRIDLSDNTNLWGAPPSVARVLGEFGALELSRYPSAYSPRLKRAIAKYADVDESMIVTGCGSDDVLDSAIRAFGAPGDLLAMQNPSFSMIPVFATVSGLSVKGVDRARLVDEMASLDAQIIYLCTPNNPTGEVLSLETIEEITSNSNGLVIVDEAYIEFGGTSCVNMLGRFENLLITRTFSKALGLAGFRIGYGIASPAIVSRVEGARGPYKVSAISEAVGTEVLENDLAWVADKAQEAVANRERFARALISIGLARLESGANFLLIPVAGAREIESRLRDRGIAVRAFEQLNGIGDALRVTVGPWPVMEEFLEALAEVTK
jgi:histidinol-phosphate aminotransferase